MPSAKPASGPVLRYAGSPEGIPFINGIPARDLTADDLKVLAADSFVRRHFGETGLAAALVGTGLYTDAASASAADADSGKESV